MTNTDKIMQAEQARVDGAKPDLPIMDSADRANGLTVAGERLKSFIERIERLEEEKSALSLDIKEIYAEAKGTGFDAKIIRKIVKLRAMDSQARKEESELINMYAAAIGLD